MERAREIAASYREMAAQAQYPETREGLLAAASSMEEAGAALERLLQRQPRDRGD